MAPCLHPNIVRHIAQSAEDETLLMVLEYITGKSSYQHSLLIMISLTLQIYMYIISRKFLAIGYYGEYLMGRVSI